MIWLNSTSFELRNCCQIWSVMHVWKVSTNWIECYKKKAWIVNRQRKSGQFLMRCNLAYATEMQIRERVTKLSVWNARVFFRTNERKACKEAGNGSRRWLAAKRHMVIKHTRSTTAIHKPSVNEYRKSGLESRWIVRQATVIYSSSSACHNCRVGLKGGQKTRTCSNLFANERAISR